MFIVDCKCKILINDYLIKLNIYNFVLFVERLVVWEFFFRVRGIVDMVVVWGWVVRYRCGSFIIMVITVGIVGL